MVELVRLRRVLITSAKATRHQMITGVTGPRQTRRCPFSASSGVILKTKKKVQYVARVCGGHFGTRLRLIAVARIAASSVEQRRFHEWDIYCH